MYFILIVNILSIYNICVSSSYWRTFRVVFVLRLLMMAPNKDNAKVAPKPTPARQRVVKTVAATTTRARSSPSRPTAAATRARPSPASPATLKKAVSSVKKIIEKVPLKMNSTTREPKPATTPGTAKKRRPVPAHSGVPVPEKMKKLILLNAKNNDIDDLI